MNSWSGLIGSVHPILPVLFAIVGVGFLLGGAHWFLIARHPDLGNERKFSRQLILLGLTLLGLVAIVFSLPVHETSRNTLIGLIGLLASGVFAFSSTTVVANLMAGILLRITKPFNIGDFIRAGDHFGRVAERGLFDTEIQSENRDLIAIPNSFLITHPVATTRSSGAIVSVTLSLGYDAHHSVVEPLLVRAAQESGLEEPFVHILELANSSVTYRISGLLVEVKWLITARSNLCRKVLDALHGEGIEIVSPAFMTQRRLPEDRRILPTLRQKEPEETPNVAEAVVFDKAEQAEQVEKEKKRLLLEIQQLENDLKEATDEEKKRIKETVEENRKHLSELEQAPPEPSDGNHAEGPSSHGRVKNPGN
jgi:small conductance mechanosensitive channel